MTSPYPPYIFKQIVSKVNQTFSARPSDPFNVFFDYGLYVDVAKSIYKKVDTGEETYPLIWLVDRWTMQRGSAGGYFGEGSFELILAMPTSNEYTADQRTELVFEPRLFAIYEELIKQISRSEYFAVQSIDKIRHTYNKQSYWGGSEGGSDTKNLFGNYIDALHIPSITLTVK